MSTAVADDGGANGRESVRALDIVVEETNRAVLLGNGEYSIRSVRSRSLLRADEVTADLEAKEQSIRHALRQVDDRELGFGRRLVDAKGHLQLRGSWAMGDGRRVRVWSATHTHVQIHFDLARQDIRIKEAAAVAEVAILAPFLGALEADRDLRLGEAANIPPDSTLTDDEWEDDD